MSLHIPSNATSLADEISQGSDDDSKDEEETWSDWLSDSAPNQPCKSLFDDTLLPSVSDILLYDKATHGFELDVLCNKLG
jgi:type I protein arginine methyltransferase